MPPPPDPVRTFTLLRDWQAFLAAQGRLSERTRKQYRTMMVAFLAEALVPLDEVTPTTVAEVLGTISSRGGYRDLMLKSLYSFYRWAAKTQGMNDPTTEFGFRKKRAGPPDYLTREELERLFVAAEDVDPRARPTLELMYATAARVRSVVELRPEDIDLDHRIVRFELGVKNDATYSLPLGPRAYAAAVRLMELQDFHPKYGKRRAGKLVGVAEQSVRNWLQEAGAKAGITRRLYPHLLRHSAITHLANDPTVSVATIVTAANWQDPTPFRRYAAARPGEVKTALSQL